MIFTAYHWLLRLALYPTLVLAQSDGGGGEIVSWDDVIKGGPFAITVVLIVTDKLTTPGERNRLREENRELREEIRALNKEVRTEITPLLGDVASNLSRLNTSWQDKT